MVRWLDQAAESDGKRWPEPGDRALHELPEETGEDEGERAVTPEGFDARHTPHEEESRHDGDGRGVAETGQAPHPGRQPAATAKRQCVEDPPVHRADSQLETVHAVPSFAEEKPW